MTWEQKFQALKALGGDFNIVLRMRKPEDWYVCGTGIEIKDKHTLTSPTESGKTPADAVEQHWRLLTDLKPDQYLVVGGYTDKRRAVRWNGFMWEDVAEEK